MELNFSQYYCRCVNLDHLFGWYLEKIYYKDKKKKLKYTTKRIKITTIVKLF